MLRRCIRLQMKSVECKLEEYTEETTDCETHFDLTNTSISNIYIFLLLSSFIKCFSVKNKYWIK